MFQEFLDEPLAGEAAGDRELGFVSFERLKQRDEESFFEDIEDFGK